MRGAANDKAGEKIEGKSGPKLDPGWLMQPLLSQVLGSDHHSELIDEMIELLLDQGQAIGCTVPFIERAPSTKARGKDLTLEY